MQTEDKLQLIVELTRLLRKEKQPTDIFSEISNIARDVTDSDRCSLYLFDGERKILYTKIAHGIAQTIEVKLGQGIAGYAAQTGEPIIDNDVYTNALFNKEIDAQTGYITHRVIAVPVKGRFNHLLGVIQVLNKLQEEFTTNDVEILTIIGELTASVLENYNDRTLLEQKVKEKTAELEHLNQNLQKKVEEKVKENREKDKIMFQQSKNAAMGEMISMITHQWRQPISGISAYASKVQLMEQMNHQEKTGAGEVMDKIIEQTRYLSQTIEDFRSFFRPDRQKSPTLLEEIISDALKFSDHAIILQNIEVIKQLAPELNATVFRNEIIQVVMNLIKNAIDAYESSNFEQKMITITTRTEAAWAMIEIQDNAGGIPEEMLQSIFQEYFTTKGNSGTGLGLYMSKMIIEERHEGQLLAQNRGNGALFTIQLPI